MNKTVKWYQGWKNILTLVAYLIYWPLAVLLMWFLASWNKKTKIIITTGFAILFFVSYLSVSGVAGGLFPQDPLAALQLARKISNYAFVLMGVTVITALILSIFRTKLKLDLRQIWVTTAVILFITFMIIMFSLLSNVQKVYQLTE